MEIKITAVIKHIFQSVFITALLVLFPWIVLHFTRGAVSPLLDLFIPFPFLLFAALAFLSYKLNRPRMLFVSFLMSVVYAYLLIKNPERLWLSSPEQALVLSLTIPVTLIGIFLLPETKLKSSRWALYLFSFLLPFGVFSIGIKQDPLFTLLLMSWRPFPTIVFQKLPNIALIMWLVFLAMGVFNRNLPLRRLHFFVGFSLIPFLFVLDQKSYFPAPANINLMMALGLTSQGWILLYAVFLLFWDRLYVDELTGAANRLALNEALSKLESNYALAMVDIDHFKKFNDTFGHSQGDHALRFVSSHLIKEHNGKVYRYGGEEFCLIFENTTPQKCVALMDDIRKKLENYVFTIRGFGIDRRNSNNGVSAETKQKSRTQITISVGIATPLDKNQTPEETLKIADRALYEAKNQGRNRVATQEDLPPSALLASH